VDYVVSKPSSIVTDKKGKIRFAGTDSEAIQWAIDKIDADQKKWYNRLWRWLGFGDKSIVNLNSSVFEITVPFNMVSNMELRSTYSKTWNEIVDEIYSTPRSRKYRYHKDHPKFLIGGDSSFSDFIHSSEGKARNEV